MVYVNLVILYLILVFIFGSAVGSFLNVVIDRATVGESILGRSHCDYCRAKLATVDLVPIISFVGLGAKCRFCKKPLSWQYPLVESATAILFAGVFWVLTASGALTWFALFYWFVLVSVSIVVAVVDFKFSMIPTSFVYAASLIALFHNYFFLSGGAFIDHLLAAFGAATFFLLIILVTRGRGMGQGDAVLAFLMGIVLGIATTILAMFVAFLSGAVVSVFLILLGRKKLGNTVPFGPFLILGLMTSLFWGQALINWYFKVLY